MAVGTPVNKRRFGARTAGDTMEWQVRLPTTARAGTKTVVTCWATSQLESCPAFEAGFPLRILLRVDTALTQLPLPLVKKIDQALTMD